MSHLAPSDAAMSPVAPATVHLRRRGRGSWHSAGVHTVQVLVFFSSMSKARGLSSSGFCKITWPGFTYLLMRPAHIWRAVHVEELRLGNASFCLSLACVSLHAASCKLGGHACSRWYLEERLPQRTLQTL